MKTATELSENILGSFEVQEILSIKRTRLKALVDTGKLTPIKELKMGGIFWKPEVEQLKKEMLQHPRSNVFKKGGEKK